MTPPPSPESLAKLEAVRAVIVNANPDVFKWHSKNCPCRCEGEEWHRRPIRLADVLLAQEPVEKRGKTEAEDALNCYRFLKMWNLRRDSLDEQSEETISFLHSLLCI